MTTITVLAGEHTIGGTQIVVEEEGARLLFDCGLVYDPAGDPFAQVHRRRRHLLPDLLALGLAPHVPGLYAPGGDSPLAVALSHSHLDHAHLAGFVRPEVPVHCTAATARIVTTLGALGRSLAPAGRPFIVVEPGAPFAVGTMRARLVPVDHDVAGACGMLIETRDGVIAYSGDLRLHGAAPELSLNFARAAHAAGARVLILEGTRLRPPAGPGTHSAPEASDRTEPAVARDASDALAAVPGRLGVILLTPENGARVEALAAAMPALGRLLVLEAESLALATAALGRPLAAPHAVYVPSGLADSRQQGESLPAILQAAVDAAPREVTAAEIASDPGAYLLRLDWEHFADLLDLLPDRAGGVVLHANGTPLGPFDPGWAQLQWWMHHLGLRIVSLDSSGHAAPLDLARIAAAGGAPVVMCIHSLHPELLDTGGAQLFLPQRGYPYPLADLDMPGLPGRQNR